MKRLMALLGISIVGTMSGCCCFRNNSGAPYYGGYTAPPVYSQPVYQQPAPTYTAPAYAAPAYNPNCQPCPPNPCVCP